MTEEYCGGSKVLVDVAQVANVPKGVRKMDKFKKERELRSLAPVEKPPPTSGEACKPRKEIENDKFATRVLPWLYLGAALDANKDVMLKRCKITHIVNLTQETPNITRWEWVDYLHITVKDHSDENIEGHFEPVLQWLEDVRQRGGIVLVHCKQGISRSATITIAYIMKHMRLPYKLAHDAVRIKRPAINPNLGFVAALESYQHFLGIPTDVNPSHVLATLQAHGLSTTLLDLAGYLHGDPHLTEQQECGEGDDPVTPPSPKTAAPPFISSGFS